MPTMHESNDLLKCNDHAIGNRDTPLELVLALQTVREFWAHDALDDLIVASLFAHGLPLLFLCSSISFHFTMCDVTDVLPPRPMKTSPYLLFPFPSAVFSH